MFQVLFNSSGLSSYICGLFAGGLGGQVKTLGTFKENNYKMRVRRGKVMGFRVRGGPNWFLDSALKRQVLDF